MEPLTLQLLEKLVRHGRVLGHELADLAGLSESDAKDALRDACARGWVSVRPQTDGRTFLAVTRMGRKALESASPAPLAIGPIGEFACPTCKARLGLGTCSTCARHIMRGAGVDGLGEWLRLAAGYLRADAAGRSRMEYKRVLLLAWLAGWDVDLA